MGDKITLPLAPLVAACGVAVPQLSGRGLGHTGGTLDKLESIPGWRALLSNEEMIAQLESVGAVICAAGDGLAPADKKLYALRDVTGTVEAIPLIASSIMSKKIAEGTGVAGPRRQGRHGRVHEGPAPGPRARRDHGRRSAPTPACTRSRCSPTCPRPLGSTAGNAIEVAESVEVLAGGGPADVVELTLALAREMLAGAGRSDVDPAEKLADGSAMDAWRRMIRAQGGDPDAPMRRARETHVVARAVLGRADPARRDGGRHGRVAARRRPRQQGDAVQDGAGVESGTPAPATRSPRAQPLFTLHTDEPERFERALASLEGGYDLAPAGTAYTPGPLVIDRIG